MKDTIIKLPSKIRNYRKILNYYKLQIGPLFSSYFEIGPCSSSLERYLFSPSSPAAAHRRSPESAGHCEQGEKKRTREVAYLNRGCELSGEDPRPRREWRSEPACCGENSGTTAVVSTAAGDGHQRC
ncbi:hypothetical protein M9H77_32702 [Catharanthus roseus]|uniref:Uncharacterized protein n=1 Tax=Catharanthus roseus TaxID=4058 RepID=A0ACC0A538_CATRO|nr:hypothetical protein M9H77_32702 [Catharanthus roseus]